jgi:hypothetical protein
LDEIAVYMAKRIFSGDDVCKGRYHDDGYFIPEHIGISGFSGGMTGSYSITSNYGCTGYSGTALHPQYLP